MGMQKNMKSLLLRSSPAFFAAFIVAACGGGDSAPTTTANLTSTELSGTAATGAPVASGLVSVTCGTASPVTTTTTSNGTWRVDVPNATFPCIVGVSGGSLPAGVQLFGYATSDTNVNVTPLTTLIGAYATRAANGGTLTQAMLDAAVTQVNDLLATAGLPPLPADPLTVTFTPVAGDKYDDYLETVMSTLAAQDITLTELVTEITTTGTPSGPIKAATIDFSDNNASAMPMPDGSTEVLQLETVAAPLLPEGQKSFNTGVRGNRANFGTEVFHGMKVSEFPGISFKAKAPSGSTTNPGSVYLNYTVSRQCDGNPDPNIGWFNLLTVANKMNASAPDTDGWVTYSATISTNSWQSTRGTLLNGSTTVLPGNGASTAMPLQAFIALYPNACIYNWPNPDAQVPNSTKTPAVMLMLGDSRTTTAKKVWFKDVKVGEVVLY